MTNYVKALLEAAVKADMRIKVVGDDGTMDYAGHDAVKALEAIDGVDEATVEIFDGQNNYRGYVLIVNGLEEDERFDINAYHATRDGNEIGGSKKVILVEQVKE